MFLHLVKIRFLSYVLNFLLNLKGTVRIILSIPSCKDDHARFTTVPIKPLTDHQGQIIPKKNLS